jgi:hypothetical protein
MALGAGSAAIDQFAAGPFCPATDQRGVSRPIGGGCDSGAFEAALPAPTSKKCKKKKRKHKRHASTAKKKKKKRCKKKKRKK